MKKKLFFGAAAFLFAVSVFGIMHARSQQAEVSGLLTSNVEALASGEHQAGPWWRVSWGSGDYWCDPNGGTYCPNF